jgi:hypothetical protein
MSIKITPDLQKILDTSEAMEEVISVNITEVPEHLLRQIEIQNCIYFDYIIRVESGDEVEVAFVVPVGSIDGDSYKHLAIKDLVSCSCVVVGEDADEFCVNNPFYNRGKTTYFIRPPDHYLVRLEHESPNVIALFTPELESLVNKIKALDKVNYVQIETVVDETLRASFNGDDPIMIVTNIDIKSDKYPNMKVYNQTTVVPKTVWGVEYGHDYALEQIREMIRKNNE